MYLCAFEALQFRELLGGEERINAYCHALAVAGGKRLQEILGTRQMDQTHGHIWTANMVSITRRACERLI